MKKGLKTDSKRRLARIAGQVAGLRKMIEGDRACNEILQQVVAVRGALDQMAIALLSEHLQTCVLHQGVTAEEDCCTDLPTEKRSDEIRTTLRRFLK
jgi:DNA-binding FrmR family transcriptional regulator